MHTKNISDERVTINITPRASVTLSKMVISLRSKGKIVYKQQLASAMIEYFRTNAELLNEIV